MATENIASILAGMHASDAAPEKPRDKTASAPASHADDLAQRRAELAAMVTDITGNTKTAAAGDDAPAQIEKLAAELTQAADLARHKQASLWGAAAADGFFARASEYANAASPATKTAAAKQAEIERDRINGYNEMNAVLTKAASEFGNMTPQQVAEQTMRADLEKIASASLDCFQRGFIVGEALIKQAQQQG